MEPAQAGHRRPPIRSVRPIHGAAALEGTGRLKAKIPEGWIVCGWSGCLDPANDTASRFNQWYGSQRFRWNRLLDREKVEFASTGKSPVAARVAASQSG